MECLRHPHSSQVRHMQRGDGPIRLVPDHPAVIGYGDGVDRVQIEQSEQGHSAEDRRAMNPGR